MDKMYNTNPTLNIGVRDGGGGGGGGAPTPPIASVVLLLLSSSNNSQFKPNNANPKHINQINHQSIIQGKADNAYLLKKLNSCSKGCV